MKYIIQNKTSWNKNTSRYLKNSDFSFDTIDFGDPRMEDNDSLNLITDVKGKKILELGCGGAHIGICLAKNGADVTCVDFSKEKLIAAKENAKIHGVNINFIEENIENIDSKKFNNFDIVISICAFQYVKDLKSLFSNIYNCLTKKGEFIFSTNDPTFYSIASNILWKDEKILSSYFYCGEEKWKWEDSDDFYFSTFRYPIDLYINTLVEIGFKIEKFHQLKFKNREINSEEEKLEELYPRAMVFKVKK